MNSGTDTTPTEFLKLIRIMKKLRSPEGCPWDRKQTTETLKPYLLEETYELLDALDDDNADDIRDELGDLLLQIVFLAEIHDERNHFAITDVIRAINEKMIRRHPHVFADESAADHALRWEQIKHEERRQKGKPSSLRSQISRNLPALKRATKTARKTRATPVENCLDNLIVKLEELKHYMNDGRPSDRSTRDRVGKILYGMAELCTSLKVDAEDALRQETKKVIAAIDDLKTPFLSQKKKSQ